MMSKLKGIINGWSAYLKGEETALAKQRAKVCKKCPYVIMGSYEKLMPDYSIKEIQGLKCKKCGCPLSTKLRSENEKCPISNW